VLARGDADLRRQAQSAIERMTRKALDGGRATPAFKEITVAFLPAPSKSKNLASARIRCSYMAAAINQSYGPSINAAIDSPDRASIIVISQTCTASALLA